MTLIEKNDCYAMEKPARCDLLDDYEEGMRQSEKCDAFLMDSKYISGRNEIKNC